MEGKTTAGVEKEEGRTGALSENKVNVRRSGELRSTFTNITLSGEASGNN